MVGDWGSKRKKKKVGKHKLIASMQVLFGIVFATLFSVLDMSTNPNASCKEKQQTCFIAAGA
jgi:hypothetical protein